MERKRLLSRLAESLAVAALGAGLALLVAASIGRLGSRTTIQQVTPLAGGGVGTTSLQTPAATGAQTAKQIYKEDAPGVVQITATSVQQTQSDPFNIFPTTPQTTEALGSGFVIDKTGHIITNYHVIQGAQKVQVSFSGRDQLAATIVGSDASTDIAVLKIDAHARALQPLQLGNSDAVSVGDPVFAIGNPFGLTRTLTTGVVSAVQRQIEAPNTLPITHAIQTDAAINHGNSGGPLLDAQGRVIGVTSQIQTGSATNQGNVGIGFAVPINTVRNVAAQIIKSGRAQHAFLGLFATPVTSQLQKLFNLPGSGLLVQTVENGSGADKAGIKGGTTKVVVEGESYQIGGDVIMKIDGQPITTTEQLFSVIQAKQPGDRIKLELWRHGSQRTVTATLGRRPDTG